MTMYVGTSGWSYKEWKPGFYPEGLPQSSFLEHYATRLTACEINATFYRLQSESTFTRWAAGTPETFRFAAKAHRRLTHSRQIAPDGEQRGFLDTFLRSVSVFGPRLGVVLFQFPPYRSRDDDAFGQLLEALPAGIRFAFEFRHDSWNVPDVYDRIADFSGTVCMSETSGNSPAALPPGPFAYVRMRADRYDDAARSAWRDLLLEEAQDRNVFVFAKHEGIPTDDPYGGIGLAVWLTQQSN